ncbi:MAG: type IV secretion system protein TraC [Agitococcus sp.]|nr:type IV secretion system protein TraC [Agitococcus sp.]
MLGTSRINDMLRRTRPEDTIPAIATIDNKLIFCEDTDKGAFVGATLVGIPLIGADASSVNRLRSSLSQSYPAGTIIQFNLLANPQIHGIVDAYVTQKIEALYKSDIVSPTQKTALSKLVEEKANYMLEGRHTPHIRTTGVPCRYTQLFISIKIPTSPKPTDTEIALADECVIKLQESLKSAGLPTRWGSAADWLGACRSIVFPFEKIDHSYEDTLPLRAQVFRAGDTITNTDPKTLKINNAAFKALSIKRLPKYASLALMNTMLGDPAGLDNQITTPYMISLVIHYPDQAAKKRDVKANHAWINHQATGMLLKFSPRLGFKKRGYDILFEDMENGSVLTESTLTMFLMSENEEQLQRASAQLQTYYSSFSLEMMQDSQILWPLLWNSMPLFPSSTSLMNSHRHRTLGTNHIVQFLPVLSDWTGFLHNPTQLMLTRRGNLFGYDLYQSATNYNALVFGGSGGGKSFSMQSTISDELAMGAKVWVVDQGRSYEKLAAAIDGEFIAFNEHSKVCLNPFTNVIEIDEEVETLTTFMEKMAAPTEGLDDYRRACLTEAIKSVWSRMGTSMTISDVVEYLHNQPDQRITDIARQLYPFTRSGQFGYWFDGVNNLNFQKNFVVLELDDLKQQELLRKVVLMMLVSRIQYEMYNAKLERKIAIFDEAKEYLDDVIIRKFISDGYRRFRKYNGSAVIITQSLKDVYDVPGMHTILNNSAHKIILQQDPAEIDSLAEKKMLPLDAYGVRMMKSIHMVPGAYSEIMYMQGQAWGIARLTVPRYLQILFSTKGAERDVILADLQRGVALDTAIRNFMATYG